MFERFLRTVSPWSPAEAIRWVFIVLVGIAVTAVAWWFSHRQAASTHQLGWVALGIAGFVAVAWADVTWLMKARSSIVERRKALLPDDLPVAVPTTALYASLLVAGADLLNFHRSDCVLAAGKGWEPVLRREAMANGQRPCGMCEP
jgi:hypothetical protein